MLLTQPTPSSPLPSPPLPSLTLIVVSSYRGLVGNHENINNIEDYNELFRRTSPFKESIVSLENEAHVIKSNTFAGCELTIAGTADWMGSSRAGWKPPNLEKALINTTDTDAVILLQHQPRGTQKAVNAGVGLQLSGHTHGGQIWPQHALLWGLQYDAISGLHKYGNGYLFVSEGIVGWGPRTRFLSVTDLALLTLRSPEIFDGPLPDTSNTMATNAMFAAVFLLPFGLLGCATTAICYLRRPKVTNQTPFKN